MKRVVVDHYGGPEVLKVVEDDDPRPGPGEVRVRVLAAGVSFTDAQLRAGTYLGVPKPPFTPGYELVGVVEELGPGCSRLRVGDRIGALTVWGADAERVCVPEANAVEVPEDLDPAEVLSLVFTYMTAYQLLHRMAKVKSGETVLVHGAAGRVGTAVLELGAVAGLRLYGTARLATAPRSSGSARWRSTTATRTSWRGCASYPARAWTSCSTGSAARCRFAPSARCGPAEGLSCSATTPRSRTGARAGEGGSSGTRRPRPSRSGACSRPAGGCSPTGSRSCARPQCFPRATRRFRGWRPRNPEWFREDFRALLELLRRGQDPPGRGRAPAAHRCAPRARAAGELGGDGKARARAIGQLRPQVSRGRALRRPPRASMSGRRRMRKPLSQAEERWRASARAARPGASGRAPRR